MNTNLKLLNQSDDLTLSNNKRVAYVSPKCVALPCECTLLAGSGPEEKDRSIEDRSVPDNGLDHTGGGMDGSYHGIGV